MLGRQTQETIIKDKSYTSKLATLLYLSGGIISEGKTARHVVSNINYYDDNYLSFLYDGRFFGLASSEVEKLFHEMRESRFVDEIYNVRKYHPVHLIRSL